MLPDNPTQDEIKRQIEELVTRMSSQDQNDVTLMDYNNDYLRSKTWRKIKRRVLDRDENTCQLCGGVGRTVHHRSYDREVLEGKADNFLVTVCDGCHNIIHNGESRQKRTYEERELILRVLKRDKKICQLCGGEGQIVHHRPYDLEVLEGKADNFLVTVCEGCHNIIQFNESGQERTHEESELILTQKQTQTDIPEPVIDLRRRHQKMPSGWDRMTDVQRQLWRKRVHQLTSEKKVARGHKEYEGFFNKT